MPVCAKVLIAEDYTDDETSNRSSMCRLYDPAYVCASNDDGSSKLVTRFFIEVLL